VIFPQVEQPRVFKGNVATIGISAGIVVFTLLTLFFQTRDEKKVATRSLTRDDDSEDSIRKNSDGAIEPVLEREDDDISTSKSPVL
jgi:MFS transporter, ACS family, pantothenate transporter